jgi:DNA-binding MarR family transcriptional regulator
MRVYTRMRTSARSFEPCRTCACSALRRASRAVTQHYERHFRGSGLRATQFTILATLAQTGPLSVSELSDQLGLERTTLSRNLRLIEDKGWISALGHDDKRVRKMALTAKGIKKASAALAFWKRADTSVEPILRRFGLQSRPMVRAK